MIAGGDILGDWVEAHTWTAIGIVTGVGALLMGAWAKWAIDNENQ